MRASGIIRAAVLAAATAAGPAVQFQVAAAPQAWVLIDFDAVVCAPCLDRLLDFTRALPEAVQQERLRGIVVFRAPAGGDADRREKIAARKWEAVRRTHDLKFPSVFHTGPPFRDWIGSSGIRLILLDPAGRKARVFDLPLQASQFDEVRAILLQ